MSNDKRKPPAFQFYADDFLAGTMDMSQEEVGAYIRLLCHQWSRGGIPADAEKRHRLAGGPVSDDVLAKFAPCDDGQLRNCRLEQVRKEQSAWSSKQAEAGRQGAVKRWKNGNPNGNPNGQTMATPMATPMAKRWPDDSSPSPSPTPYLETHTKGQLPLDVAVDPPAGFPTTEQDAAPVADFVGCPREFAVDVWHRAMSRGGRDHKDVPIRSWRSYLRTCWTSEQGRKEKQAAREAARPRPSNGRQPLAKTPDDAGF